MPVHPSTVYHNLIKSHRYREASWLAVKTAKTSTGTESSLWYCRQATADLLDNRNESACAAADTACSLSPDDPTAYLLKADTLLLLDRIEEAEESYRRALSLGADAGRTHRGILDCQIKSGRFDEALSSAGSSSLSLESRFFYTVRILSELNRTDEALALCENPPHAADAPSVAWLRCTLELKRDGAETVLSRYRAQDAPEGQRKIHRELIRYCERQGEIPADEKEKKKFLQSMKQSAFTLAKAGHEAAALPMFENLLRIFPADAYLNNTYIAASRRAGFLHSAQEFYRRLVCQFPEERLINQRLTRLHSEKKSIFEKY